jgi:pentose-5-phosphate-3-epimerase/CBS domain-containing protein
VKISASIAARGQRELKETLLLLEEYEVDFIHVDCLENPAVFEELSSIRRYSQIPIDFHLIARRPQDYYAQLLKHEVEQFAIQIESVEGKLKLDEMPETLRAKMGIAISSETPLEIFEPFASEASFALLMCSTPGKSGGQFDRRNFKRIRKFQRLYPKTRIFVDGGVNAQISFVLRNMGIHAAISGSYLLHGSTVGSQLLRLSHAQTDSDIAVGDFMLQRSEIPIISKPNPDLGQILRSIEAHKMGFTLLEDENEKLLGLISNADVRKGLLNNLDDLNATRWEEMINRNPIHALENQTVEAMLKVIKACPFPILYLPVVDDQGRLRGAVQFNNLIKGEL